MPSSAGFVAALPSNCLGVNVVRHGPSRSKYLPVRRRERVVLMVSSSTSNTNESSPNTSKNDVESGDPAAETPSASTDNLSKVIVGTGSEGCEQCAGVGSIACPVCGSKGYVSMNMMDTVSAGQCRLCRGKCVIPCPSCRDFIYRAVVWWDQIPDDEEDPEENWRNDDEGNPRIPWSPPPA